MCKRLSAVALVVACGGLARAGSAPVVLYSNIAGVNDSVPGSGGLVFASFERPWRSPNGLRWGILARNTGEAPSDAMYLTGEGTQATLRIREGVTPITAGRMPEGMNDRRIGVLDDGQYGVVLNLSGATGDDQVGVIGNAGGSVAVAIREGERINAIDAARFGTQISDVSITSVGGGAAAKLAVRAASIVGVSADKNAAFVLNNGDALAAQAGVTTPDGTQTVLSFNVDGAFASATGSSHLYLGDLNGPATTSQVLVVNQNAAIREGQTLAGMASPVSRINSAHMESSGDWFARGENLDHQAWVVRTGLVVARSGDVIANGTDERWSTAVWDVLNGNTFFLCAGNNAGDFVVAGFTDAEDGSRNAAWVLNNGVVVMRRGDAVDLDGDGAADDAFIELTGLVGASLDGKADGGFLTDDGWLYFIADLRNAKGEDLGEAFLRKQVFSSVPPCAADVNGDGTVSGADLSVVLGAFGTAQPEGTNGDLNGDGVVDGRDLSVVLAGFGEGC